MNGPVIRTMHGENAHLRLRCQEMTPNHLATGNNKGSHSIDHILSHLLSWCCAALGESGGLISNTTPKGVITYTYSVYTHTFAYSHETIDIANAA